MDEKKKGRKKKKKKRERKKQKEDKHVASNKGEPIEWLRNNYRDTSAGL